METTQTQQAGKPLVMKPAISETLLAFAPGQKAKYYAGELGSYSAAYTMAKRMTERGDGEWKVTPEDNGAMYTIERIA